MLEDTFLPTYDISDGVAVEVAADPAAAYAALMDVDLIELGRRRPLVGALGAARAMPELALRALHGEGLPERPGSMRLRDLAGSPAAEGGWVLLAEQPGEAIALGLVGRFWRPVIEFADVAAEDFTRFAEPGYAKTVYALAARPLDEGRRTLLTAVMRTATTDERARRNFGRYWTLGVGAGAHVLARSLLEVARDAAARGLPTAV
jgi:hypothetical protein